jgi:dihydrofolate reductase
MGKIIANVNITLDGIFTGPSGDEGNIVSWAMPGIVDSSDDDLEMFQNAEAILMGRVTYEGFSYFWPFQSGAWADAMNRTKKYVVSNNRDLAEVHWGDYSNTITLFNAGAMDRVAQLKKEIQGNIIVSASGTLVKA